MSSQTQTAPVRGQLITNSVLRVRAKEAMHALEEVEKVLERKNCGLKVRAAVRHSFTDAWGKLQYEIIDRLPK